MPRTIAAATPPTRQGTPAHLRREDVCGFPRAFSQAAHDLADWHLNDETVACHPRALMVCGEEEEPYCLSSAEEALIRSPILTGLPLLEI